MYQRLHIISQADYEKWDTTRTAREDESEKYKDHYEKARKDRNEKLTVAKKKFPFIVLTEGGYYDHDFAEKWCWDNVGLKDGPV